MTDAPQMSVLRLERRGGALVATIDDPATRNAISDPLLADFDLLFSHYRADPAVREVAAGLMLFAALWQLADATQVLAIGALRGYHVTFGPMLVMFVAFWLIGLPLGVRLGYYGIGNVPPLAVYGFWTGLVTALILAAIALAAWLRVVARERIGVSASGA